MGLNDQITFSTIFQTKIKMEINALNILSTIFDNRCQHQFIEKLMFPFC